MQTIEKWKQYYKIYEISQLPIQMGSGIMLTDKYPDNFFDSPEGAIAFTKKDSQSGEFVILNYFESRSRAGQ